VRWLALLIVLLAGEASARKIVISEPPIVRACPGGASWSAVETCLGKQGTMSIVKTLPKAKLVRLLQSDGSNKKYDAGVYLYVEQAKGAWRMGGMYDGSPYTVIDLLPLTIGKHDGYRLDIGQFQRSSISIDGVTSVAVILSTRRTLFCAGDRYGCADATASCDVLIEGRTWFTFRGTFVFEKGQVRVVGDRKYAGPACAAEERVYIGWPET